MQSIFYFTAIHSTCFGCRPHLSSGVHKTVVTATGTNHIICAVTSVQRGQIWPHWSEVATRTYDLYQWL
jgi:hypothetical protein